MEYFELSQERAVENPIEVMNLDRNIYTYQMKEKVYEKLETLKVYKTIKIRLLSETC